MLFNHIVVCSYYNVVLFHFIHLIYFQQYIYCEYLKNNIGTNIIGTNIILLKLYYD